MKNLLGDLENHFSNENTPLLDKIRFRHREWKKLFISVSLSLAIFLAHAHAYKILKHTCVS